MLKCCCEADCLLHLKENPASSPDIIKLPCSTSAHPQSHFPPQPLAYSSLASLAFLLFLEHPSHAPPPGGLSLALPPAWNSLPPALQRTQCPLTFRSSVKCLCLGRSSHQSELSELSSFYPTPCYVWLSDPLPCFIFLQSTCHCLEV